MKQKIFPTWGIVLVGLLVAICIGAIGLFFYAVFNPSFSKGINEWIQNNFHRNAETVLHSLYLTTIQDPDMDKDGLEDSIAEPFIYNTNPQKYDTAGVGVSDGEYIYGVYIKALTENNDAVLKQYEQNFADYKEKATLAHTYKSLLGHASLDDAFLMRSLQTYNVYVGMSDAERQVVAQSIAFREKKDYGSSLVLLQKALSENPNSAIIKYHIALTYRGLKRYDEALALFKSIMNDPSVKSPILYSDMAFLYNDMGLDDQFVGILKQSINEFPQDLSQYLTLSQYYIQKQDLDTATDILNQGLAIEPRFADFYNALADIAHIKNDFREEFRLYKKAALYDFRYAPAHTNLSILYGNFFDDPTDAMVEAKIALSLDRSPRHIGMVITLYSAKGDYAKADELTKELLAMPDIDSRTYNDLGFAYMDRKDYVSAEKYLTKAIALEPTLSNAYNNIGIVQLSTNRLEAAAVSFKKAIELNPNYVNAYNNLGIYYTDKADYPNAIATYKKAIALNPTMYRSYGNLGYVYFLMNDKVNAKYYYQKAADLGSKEPSVLEKVKELSQ